MSRPSSFAVAASATTIQGKTIAELLGTQDMHGLVIEANNHTVCLASYLLLSNENIQVIQIDLTVWYEANSSLTTACLALQKMDTNIPIFVVLSQDVGTSNISSELQKIGRNILQSLQTPTQQRTSYADALEHYKMVVQKFENMQALSRALKATPTSIPTSTTAAAPPSSNSTIAVKQQKEEDARREKEAAEQAAREREKLLRELELEKKQKIERKKAEQEAKRAAAEAKKLADAERKRAAAEAKELAAKKLAADKAEKLAADKRIADARASARDARSAAAECERAAAKAKRLAAQATCFHPMPTPPEPILPSEASALQICRGQFFFVEDNNGKRKLFDNTDAVFTARGIWQDRTSTTSAKRETPAPQLDL